MKKYNIEQIAKYYFEEKLTITEISKIVGVSTSTIKYQLKKYGYVLENKSHCGNNRKHYVDTNFFKNIDNKNKAYLLGLIVSDGYVDNYAKLTFTSKDAELVEIFKRELKSEHKLAKYEIFDKRTNKTYVRYSLQIASKEIVDDLNNLGIYSNKSFNCSMPNISTEYFWHFVRGLFDGDGSIIKDSMKEGRLRFKIIGSEILISEIKKLLIMYGLSNTKISISKYFSNQGRIVSILYYSYKDLSILRENIYADSENLRLSKKYDIFQTLFEHRRGANDRTINLRKLEMYDYETKKYIKTFINIHDAIKEINSTYKLIHRVANGERNHTKGYLFKYI